MKNFFIGAGAIVILFFGIATTAKLYRLPQETFSYSLPGYYEIYEQEWDGRSNPIIPTGEYEFSEGGYNDILFRYVISSILLCYIAYRIGKTLPLSNNTEDSIDIFWGVWYFGIGCLVLYNLGWISRTTMWHYAKPLSYALFILSAISFVISFFVVPCDSKP